MVFSTWYFIRDVFTGSRNLFKRERALNASHVRSWYHQIRWRDWSETLVPPGQAPSNRGGSGPKHARTRLYQLGTVHSRSTCSEVGHDPVTFDEQSRWVPQVVPGPTRDLVTKDLL